MQDRQTADLALHIIRNRVGPVSAAVLNDDDLGRKILRGKIRVDLTQCFRQALSFVESRDDDG